MVSSAISILLSFLELLQHFLETTTPTTTTAIGASWIQQHSVGTFLGHPVFGQLFRQLWTRLHHVFICGAQTVNTYNFYVLWLFRISLDCVLVQKKDSLGNIFAMGHLVSLNLRSISNGIGKKLVRAELFDNVFFPFI